MKYAAWSAAKNAICMDSEMTARPVTIRTRWTNVLFAASKNGFLSIVQSSSRGTPSATKKTVDTSHFDYNCGVVSSLASSAAIFTIQHRFKISACTLWAENNFAHEKLITDTHHKSTTP